MYSNQKGLNSKSAYHLAKECKLRKDLTGINVCLKNIVNFLDKIDLDFIALQEATNWKKIINESSKLKKMKFIHHKSENEDMVSFYNPKLFKLEAVKVGNIIDGRPYQILFLNDKNKNKFIIINLHNAHNTNRKILEQAFSKKLTKGIKQYYLKNNCINLHQVIEKNIFNIISKYTNPHVIILGDFNDEGANFWKILKPFKYNSLINFKNIKVSSNKKPPNTCFTPNHINKSLRKTLNDDKYITDYILINNNLKFVDNNYLPNELIFEYNAYKKPSSDHLPIMAKIKINKKKTKKKKYYYL